MKTPRLHVQCPLLPETGEFFRKSFGSAPWLPWITFLVGACVGSVATTAYFLHL